ncbi:MAG TPA: hypothetical protein ENK57_05445 [Polyangiaceae bacterium]|nr:hypothetical protein [Polyangiaceae bacterium]
MPGQPLVSRTALFCVATLLFACSGPDGDDAGLDAGPDSGSVGAGDANVDATVCTPTAAEPFLCEDMTPDPACPASWVVGVTGRVETAAGVGVENARAQFCVRLYPDDRLVCLAPPRTDANGDFVIIVPLELRCLNRAAMRAIAPGMPFATSYCPVVFPAGSDPVFNITEPYVVHPVTAATVPPVGDETAARDVVFDSGLVLNLAPDDFVTQDYLELAGASVPVAATSCFADGVSIDGAYVFKPEDEITGGAAVSIPNTTGLAPGAVVDLRILGGLETRQLDGTEVEEGELALIGTATVSADGTMLVGDNRVPYLSWLLWTAR